MATAIEMETERKKTLPTFARLFTRILHGGQA